MSRLLDLAAGRLRVASLVLAAAMVGAGGAAAMTVTTVADSTPDGEREPTSRGRPTGPSDEAPRPPTRPPTTATDEATDDATDEATDEESTEGDDEAAEDDEADAPLDPEACAAAGNHGEYVSFIAHLTKSDPSHGVLVSAAAHSDCGKVAAEETTEPTDEASDEATESDESGDAKAKKDEEGAEGAQGQEEQLGQEPRQGQEQALTVAADLLGRTRTADRLPAVSRSSCLRAEDRAGHVDHASCVAVTGQDCWERRAFQSRIRCG